ncbi:hypothetical protein ACQP2U_43215 (plasmid) [Nocardia sp. CA-084685]|uniref:hypothetical protein n=1 Tax=Nocardia sp. CA-084685 TaxID=3239970 RepID=UPI003D9760E0
MIDFLMQGPPTEHKPLPSQVWDPLYYKAFSWFLWFGIVFSIGTFIATIGALAWQRRSASSTNLLEEATLLRILLGVALLGSSMAIAQSLLSQS